MAEVAHNGDVEAHQADQASFQVLSGGGGEDESRWVAFLVGHMVGENIQVH